MHNLMVKNLILIKSGIAINANVSANIQQNIMYAKYII